MVSVADVVSAVVEEVVDFLEVVEKAEVDFLVEVKEKVEVDSLEDLQKVLKVQQPLKNQVGLVKVQLLVKNLVLLLKVKVDGLALNQKLVQAQEKDQVHLENQLPKPHHLEDLELQEEEVIQLL